MVFQFYNLTFRRLDHSRIELLRSWRNAEWVRPYMHDRKHITPEMQDKWFRSIDNLKNWYFIIELRGEPVGAVSLRDVDLEKGVAEPGILMARDDEELMVPAAIAMLFQGEIGFHLFGLRSFIAHLYRSHTRSLSNQFVVGAKIVGDFGENSIYAEGTKEAFDQKKPKIRSALNTLFGEETSQIKITVNRAMDDPQVLNHIKSCFASLADDEQKNFFLSEKIDHQL